MRSKNSDDSEFFKEYEKMNKSDRCKKNKIDHNEQSHGYDSVIWSFLDNRGKFLGDIEERNQFVNMPNEKIVDLIYQAQNQFFALVAKMKEYGKETKEYKRLKAKLDLKNELIEKLQAMI